jgi:Type I phosphodiesterase / nucleotide pyrophosphatase
MKLRFVLRAALVAGTLAVAGFAGAQEAQPPHNLVIFVADGLRSRIVDAHTAPGLQAVREQGVDFVNSHSLFPTITTPNASAIATGHRLGDTGDFGNVLYFGAGFGPPYSSPIQPLEDDVVLGLLDARYGGDYLHQRSLLDAAREKGWNTAAVGKLGPTAIQAVAVRDGRGTIVIDDLTNYPGGDGLPLDPEITGAIKAAGLPVAPPDRGLNSSPGAYNMPGVQVANIEQQAWFADVATKVLLPRFKASGKPFVLVFWSRDPDGTQHNEGDSLNSLTPGINGPTSMKGVRNASDNLQQIRDALAALGLDKTTDIFVTADHGFATESRQSKTSEAAKLRYSDTPPGFLPGGFLAIDLSHALGLTLNDAFGFPVSLREGVRPKGGALLGKDPAHPDVAIAFNGGADEIWIPSGSAELARKIVAVLTAEDYTSAIFVDDALGNIAGALPMSSIGIVGTAVTPRPQILVSFRSFGTGCDDPEICGAEVADSDLQQGQGIHGTFGRQDTHNFMAAIGPDFKAGFRDPAPVSNADIAPTLARVIGLDLGGGGEARGRVIEEALANGTDPAVQVHVTRSDPAANGFVTILDWQETAGVPYFDAAGAPGRTIGLKETTAAQ